MINNDTKCGSWLRKRPTGQKQSRGNFACCKITSEAGSSNATFAAHGPVHDDIPGLILKTYGLEWGELKEKEVPIEISRSGDIAEGREPPSRRARQVPSRQSPQAERSRLKKEGLRYVGHRHTLARAPCPFGKPA